MDAVNRAKISCLWPTLDGTAAAVAALAARLVKLQAYETWWGPSTFYSAQETYDELEEMNLISDAPDYTLLKEIYGITT